MPGVKRSWIAYLYCRPPELCAAWIQVAFRGMCHRHCQLFCIHSGLCRRCRDSSYLARDIALYFSSMCESDSAEQIRRMIERHPQLLQAKKEADGFADDKGSQWTTFSAKSTYIQPIPGQFVAPLTISAHVCYDIESLKNLLPASQCFEDVKAIKRVRARFSRPSTERTIIWNIEQVGLYPDFLFNSF
ncbi:hypothetical protein B0H10DRAFT_1299057 [Mycena sp. CBHHK59/15]|nr:hypothetical protein B0H10DRAFT_1299057 [Mycena sp. CBHHK59/15]